MKHFYPKLMILMLPFFASAQLYIGEDNTNSYVFNKGEILFVTQQVQLEGTPDQDQGNLYLRNEGQLIQGDNTSANLGGGVVSVYQENTRNAWDYHMWASPVGDPLNTNTTDLSGNSGNKKFYLSDDFNGGVYQVTGELSSSAATFSGNYNGVAAPLTLSTTWLYKYIATQGYSGWSAINSTNPLLPGEGFSMKGVGTATDSAPTGGTAFDFRGRPNNGNIEVTVKPKQRTLVGNPYPSAMNLSYYLLYNSGQSVANCVGTYSGTPTTGTHVITGDAYFWESDPAVQSHYLADYLGGYGTFSPLMDCTSIGTYTAPTYVMYNEDGTVRQGGPVINTDDPDPKVNEIDRKMAPIGQGFFVLGRDLTPTEQTDVDGGASSPIFNVIVKNEFRTFVKESSGASLFRKPESSKGSNSKKTSETKSASSMKAGAIDYDEFGNLIMPMFTVSTVVNKQYVRTLKGVMYENATLGFDRAGDGQNRSRLASDVNFLLEGSNRPYLINIFPYDIDQKLGLKVDGAKDTNNYQVRVTNLNFETDEGIWLHDKQTGEYHDILNKTYEFELPKGSYSDRFEITFKDVNAVNLDIAEEVKESFAVYQNNGRAELTVLNPLETELKEINVFDITGRLLVSKINEGTNAKVIIPSSSWSDGVYIVKVTTRENVEFAKKISVINVK